jgi:hypothetical protein
MLCAYAVDDISVANTNTYHALRAALRAMLFPSQLQIQAERSERSGRRNRKMTDDEKSAARGYDGMRAIGG